MAECYISYKGSVEIENLIEKRKFNFDGYEKLCQRLKNNNAGLSLTTISQISPYQTTASVSIALYPVESKYKGVTYITDDWIGYDAERTSNAESNKVYNLTMDALNNLSKPEKEERLKSMLVELSEMRKAMK
jgi:hypothetical protein